MQSCLTGPGSVLRKACDAICATELLQCLDKVVVTWVGHKLIQSCLLHQVKSADKPLLPMASKSFNKFALFEN